MPSGSRHSGTIAPTARVSSQAHLAPDVRVDDYAIIEADVEIGSGCWIGPHTVIQGPTRMGADNRIYQFASVGAPPQDLKYAGEASVLTLGKGNTVRECATLHRGTAGGGMATTIGDDNLFMAYAHVAHDCHVGNRVVMANGATLAGHVDIGDGVVLGGLSAVHQFCRLGRLAMISGGSMVAQDVPPFMLAQGDRATVRGLNLVGLRRQKLAADAISDLKQAFRILYRSGYKMDAALAELEPMAQRCPIIGELVAFVRQSQRGLASASEPA